MTNNSQLSHSQPSEQELYQLHLNNKVTDFRSMFSLFSLPDYQIFSSRPQNYRMRAEFRIWHKGEALDHIMFDPQTKKRILIEHFPMANELINQAMVAIVPLLKINDIRRHRLFQIDYLSTLSGQLIISLIYHRKLDDDWIREAKIIRQALQNQGFNLQLIGRSSNQKICLDHDYIDEKLTLLGKNFIYRQIENSFTQPNAEINVKMLEWAITATKNIAGDLLELYCGNGNFAIALAQNFNKVLATEIAKASVKAAQYNIEINGLNNVNIARLSAEEFTEAIQEKRTFKRLANVELNSYDCNTVLVDPPRGGLDENTLNMVADYKTIIYISCNPITLKNNLMTLTKTHKIIKMALFDQFPYTNHLETGMVLSKFI